MRQYRKASCTILALCLLLLGVSGCMKTGKKNINVLALEYMEEKYGEPFSYESPYGDSITGTHKLLVSCASLPEEHILVEIENFRHDDRIFRDNLLAVKYKDETMRFLEDRVAEQFGEGVVFYEPTKVGLSEDLMPDAAFESFLADPKGFFMIGVEVRASSFDSKEKAECLAQSLCDAGMQFRLMLLSVSDEEYGTLSSDEFFDRRAMKEFVTCVEFTNLNGEFHTNWVEKG